MQLFDPICFCDVRGGIRVYVVVDYDHGHDMKDAIELAGVLRDCVGGVMDATLVAGSDEIAAADLDPSRVTACVAACVSHPPTGAACPNRLTCRELVSRLNRILRRLFPPRA